MTANTTYNRSTAGVFDLPQQKIMALLDETKPFGPILWNAGKDSATDYYGGCVGK